MKAERRHELQDNSLAKVLATPTSASRRFGGMALMVLLAAAVAFLLIRYRINSSREGRRLAAENLSAARNNIRQLGQLEFFPVPAQQKLSYRKQWAADAASSIDQVAGATRDPKLQAEALIARGDLNWALATMPELPGAATQPMLRYDGDRNALLGAAEAAYGEVLTQYADQKPSGVAANLGLAAVAEQLGNWDRASSCYDAVANDATIAAAFRTQARLRLQQLPLYRQPVLLAAATTRPQPAGSPAAVVPVPGFEREPATTTTRTTAAPPTSPPATSLPATASPAATAAPTTLHSSPTPPTTAAGAATAAP